MDKEEATKTLAEIINVCKEQNRVKNTAHQMALLTGAIHYSEIKCDPEYNELTTLEARSHSSVYSSNHTRVYESCEKKHKEKLNKYGNTVSQANYIFIETNNTIASTTDRYNDGVTTAIAKSELTYFAIIGEKEIKHLKEIYKGDLDEKSEQAAKTLGIYEDLQLNYTEIMKEQPLVFCEYFKKVSNQKRVDIISENWELLNEGEIDANIKHLLSNMYKHLVEDVGRDKLIENE